MTFRTDLMVSFINATHWVSFQTTMLEYVVAPNMDMAVGFSAEIKSIS